MTHTIEMPLGAKETWWLDELKRVNLEYEAEGLKLKTGDYAIYHRHPELPHIVTHFEYRRP